MLKISFKYFFIFILFSVFGVWISNNYGVVDIFWFGYKIHTSVPVLFILGWILFFVVRKFISFFNWFLHVRNPFKNRK